MHIDFNRICKLAGVSNNSSSIYNKRIIRESAYQNNDEMYMEGEADPTDEQYMEGEVDPDDQDEMVEVDVSELMSEIRRAKKIMVLNEQRKRNIIQRKRQLKENHLKRIIKKEVDNILSEIEDKDSSWVYGNRKPRYSKNGYTNHGRTMPGIGFHKKW